MRSSGRTRSRLFHCRLGRGSYLPASQGPGTRIGPKESWSMLVWQCPPGHIRPEPKRRTARPACYNANMDTDWVRISWLGGRDRAWSTFGPGGLAGRGPDVATCCSPGRGGILSRPQLAPGAQGHRSSAGSFCQHSQSLPPSLPPSSQLVLNFHC